MSDDEIEGFGEFSSSSSSSSSSQPSSSSSSFTSFSSFPGGTEKWDDSDWVSGGETTDSDHEKEKLKEKGRKPKEPLREGSKDGEIEELKEEPVGYTRVIEGRGLLACEDSGDEWGFDEEDGGSKKEEKKDDDWCKWD